MESLTARRFISLAVRLAAYQGTMSARFRNQVERQHEIESNQAQEHSALVSEGTRDFLETNPMFAGLGSFSTAPLAE